GSQGGELLAALAPAEGVGVEVDAGLRALAAGRFPQYTYVGSLTDIPAGKPFDYITICNTVGHMHDVQATLTALRPLCAAHTRLVIAYQNAVWEPILKLSTWLGWRRPAGAQNWLSRDDLANLLDLAGYEPIRVFCETLLPRYVPGLNALLNRFAVKFWPGRHLGLNVVVVARPLLAPFPDGPPR